MMEYIWQYLFLLFNLSVIAYDFRFRRVPNQLILVALAVQAVWMTIAAFGYFPDVPVVARWPEALTGLVISLVLFYPLWRFRAVGAGDVKFIGILGFCIGLAGLLPTLLIGSVLAAAHAMVLVLLQGWSTARAAWWQNADLRRGIPYAAYLSIGALAGVLWQALYDETWLQTLASR